MPGSDYKSLTAQLLSQSQDIEKDGWQLGRTKVFIRKPETLFKFEEMREEFIQVRRTFSMTFDHT